MEATSTEKEIPVTKRIRVFNSIFKEFHADIQATFEFKKVKKFSDFIQFQKNVSDNIDLLLKKNLVLVGKIKLLKNYVNLIVAGASSNETNKDAVFKYIKNMYYITFEEQSKIEEIKKILDLKNDDLFSMINLMMSDKDSIKLKQFIESLYTEFKEEFDTLGLEDSDSISQEKLSELFQHFLQGNSLEGNESELLTKLGIPADKVDPKKIQELLGKVKTRIEQKVQNGEFPKKELQKLIAKFKNNFF